MAPQDINWLAKQVARDSDFERMMWFSYYMITDDGSNEEENAAFKIVISHIVEAATAYRFNRMKIYDMSLSSFVLIMDQVHVQFAHKFDDFDAHSSFFKLCLQVLMDNDLIDANPMEQLMEDESFYGKYGW